MAWFASLNGAVALSVLAMLSFIGYALLESRYFLEQWIPGIPAAALETLFVLVMVGFWTWALFAAGSGKRVGLAAALAFSTISALIALFDLILYSPIPYGWPLLQIAVWVMLIANAVAIVSLALNLSSSS
jgi:hypothetical protein